MLRSEEVIGSAGQTHTTIADQSNYALAFVNDGMDDGKEPTPDLHNVNDATENN